MSRKYPRIGFEMVFSRKWNVNNDSQKVQISTNNLYCQKLESLGYIILLPQTE